MKIRPQLAVLPFIFFLFMALEASASIQVGFDIQYSKMRTYSYDTDLWGQYYDYDLHQHIDVSFGPPQADGVVINDVNGERWKKESVSFDVTGLDSLFSGFEHLLDDSQRGLASFEQRLSPAPTQVKSNLSLERQAHYAGYRVYDEDFQYQTWEYLMSLNLGNGVPHQGIDESGMYSYLLAHIGNDFSGNELIDRRFYHYFQEFSPSESSKTESLFTATITSVSTDAPLVPSPEPTTLALLALGGACSAFVEKMRRRVSM